MLKELITEERIQLMKSVKDWQEAIKLAASPLVLDGSITNRYVDAMIASVIKHGPYIVLEPGIALPHARPESGANRMAMALLRVEKKVFFDDEKYANLFFVLASADGTSHIDALREMAKIFGDITALESFLNAGSKFEIIDILDKYHD